ncbi:MAG: hydrogenase expression/formation protein HypE [Planctomycetes bacterium]|nr:hydrogenase expression/formation protein HypE [Planctomycetota bacterium]
MRGLPPVSPGDPCVSEPEKIQLAHGGGGRRTRALLDRLFLPAFENPALARRHDSAVLSIVQELSLPQAPGGGSARIAFTTDSFVVSPLFFPGGDIGRLAICGTVNDLAMAGAEPRWLSAGFILEEGLEVALLERIVSSMRAAAREAGVEVVTGDTKVVDRGKGDGAFIATSGIGIVPGGLDISPARVRPGDAILVSGDVGRHGIAILSVREGLIFEGDVTSDVAPLASLASAVLASGAEVHCFRDLTRGGLATALIEIALDGRAAIEVEERDVPVNGAVSGACEILGLDPLYVACEGRFVAFVSEESAGRALAAMRAHPLGQGAARIGSVGSDRPGTVRLHARSGGSRPLDLLSGEQLPRIC